MWPILQTAAAAVAAWYLALALLGGDQPLFAPIAAVIALGATVGQRGQRAFELVGGVILGIAVADLIVAAIGTGPWQAGVMVVLAMGTAVALGGRELLVAEAAVSAILIATLPGAGAGFPPERFLEAIIGGGVALVASVLLFPPDPALLVGRALNRLFADLGRALGDVARGARARRRRGGRAGARTGPGAFLAPDRRPAGAARAARDRPLRPAAPRAPAASSTRIERSLGAVDYATRDAGRARPQRAALPARGRDRPRAAARGGRRARRRGLGARRQLRRRAPRRAGPPARARRGHEGLRPGRGRPRPAARGGRRAGPLGGRRPRPRGRAA